MRGEGHFLDHQRAPGVEQDVAGGREPEQQRDRCKVRRNQERLQYRHVAGLDPVADQKQHLRSGAVDGGKVRIVDLIQNRPERRRDTHVQKEGFGRYAIGRAGGRKAVAVPQVAIEVVLEERPAGEAAKAKDHCPQEQPRERNRLVPPDSAQVEQEHRGRGPEDNAVERDKARLASLTCEHRERRVTQGAKGPAASTRRLVGISAMVAATCSHSVFSVRHWYLGEAQQGAIAPSRDRAGKFRFRPTHGPLAG